MFEACIFKKAKLSCATSQIYLSSQFNTYIVSVTQKNIDNDNVLYKSMASFKPVYS